MDDRFQPVKNHVTRRMRRVGNVKIWDLLLLCHASEVTHTLRGHDNMTSALDLGSNVSLKGPQSSTVTTEMGSESIILQTSFQYHPFL